MPHVHSVHNLKFLEHRAIQASNMHPILFIIALHGLTSLLLVSCSPLFDYILSLLQHSLVKWFAYLEPTTSLIELNAITSDFFNILNYLWYCKLVFTKLLEPIPVQIDQLDLVVQAQELLHQIRYLHVRHQWQLFCHKFHHICISFPHAIELLDNLRPLISNVRHYKVVLVCLLLGALNFLHHQMLPMINQLLKLRPICYYFLLQSNNSRLNLIKLLSAK